MSCFTLFLISFQPSIPICCGAGADAPLTTADDLTVGNSPSDTVAGMDQELLDVNQPVPVRFNSYVSSLYYMNRLRFLCQISTFLPVIEGVFCVLHMLWMTSSTNIFFDFR